MAPVCVFCASGDMSREDAIPTWMLRRILPPGGGTRLSITGNNSYSPGRFHHRPATGKDVQVPVVCRSCNSGWMNSLEEGARPYLRLAMKGLAVPVTPDAKRAIAAWSVKTAAMLLYYQREPRPPHPYYLEWLYREKDWPPPKAKVWLASYAGHTPGEFDIRAPQVAELVRRAIEPYIRKGVAQLVSLSLGAFVMQVWLWEDPGQPMGWPPLSEDYRDSVIEIWPGTPEVQEWPPPRPFDDMGLWRFFGLTDAEIHRNIDLLTQPDGDP